MSETDGLMGGETRDGGPVEAHGSSQTEAPDAEEQSEQVDSESDDSFPASDPPANY